MTTQININENVSISYTFEKVFSGYNVEATVTAYGKDAGSNQFKLDEVTDEAVIEEMSDWLTESVLAEYAPQEDDFTPANYLAWLKSLPKNELVGHIANCITESNDIKAIEYTGFAATVAATVREKQQYVYRGEKRGLSTYKVSEKQAHVLATNIVENKLVRTFFNI